MPEAVRALSPAPRSEAARPSLCSEFFVFGFLGSLLEAVERAHHGSSRENLQGGAWLPSLNFLFFLTPIAIIS